ncbi:MAG: EAL domain-containing protein [Xanthomonadales bacterium]|nr:EAL domain-containing protein [Xanthomonadales bacterium]
MNAAILPEASVLPTQWTGLRSHSAVRGLLEALHALVPADVTLALAWRDAQGGSDVEAFGPREALARAGAVDALAGRHGDGQCLQARVDDSVPYVLLAHPQGRVDAPGSEWMDVIHSAIHAMLTRLLADSRVQVLSEAHRIQRALFRISELSQSGLDLRTTLERIHDEVAGLIYAQNIMIMLWDRDKDEIRIPYFVDQVDHWPVHDGALPLARLANSLTVRMMQKGEPMMGPSSALAVQFGIAEDDCIGPPSLSWLGVPMMSDGVARGAVVVQSYDRPNRYSRESAEVLAYVAQHIQIVLDRRDAKVGLEDQVAQRTRELRDANAMLELEIQERKRAERLQAALFRISEMSSSQGDGWNFYSGVHAVLDELIDSRNFFIALVSEDPGFLDFVYVADELDNIPARVPRGRGVADYVVNNGRPLLLDEATLMRLQRDGLIDVRGQMAVSWLGVPLLRNGIPVGLMAIQSYREDVRFGAQDMELLSFAAQHVSVALERRGLLQELEGHVRDRTRELAETNRTLLAEIGERIRIEQRLQYQASHDGLTGLPNRQQLLERLQLNMLTSRGSVDMPGFAVLYLDLDQFKLINDSMGHAAGDEMLVQVAKRIRGELGPHDLVARLGGDEFAVLAELVSGVDEVTALAERIIKAFEAPIFVHDRELFPSASVGIAMWRPGYESGEEILRDADAAMYRAKANGRSQAMVFDEAMRAESLRLLDLEADLRRSIIADAFDVHLQPIVHLGNGRVVGHEALVRWRHETQGLLAPSAFIGVGEDSGLVLEIDWLVYRKVAEWMAAARTRGYVSINVSPLHFRSPEFAVRLLSTLDAAGADPSHLRIEVTEASLLEDTGRTLEQLKQLKSRGVLAMLDDFGTGFSALSYLRSFPFHALKIDRSFVAGLQDSSRGESEALVRAIVSLADGLGIDCIAEGVETRQQRDCLREEGCQYGQGFLFGRPQALNVAGARNG